MVRFCITATKFTSSIPAVSGFFLVGVSPRAVIYVFWYSIDPKTKFVKFNTEG